MTKQKGRGLLLVATIHLTNGDEITVYDDDAKELKSALKYGDVPPNCWLNIVGHTINTAHIIKIGYNNITN